MRGGRPHPIGWLFRADRHYGGVPPRAGDVRGPVSIPRQAVREAPPDRHPLKGFDVGGSSKVCMRTETVAVFRHR